METEKLAKQMEGRAHRDAAIKARNKWRPTPSQEENDRVARGEPPDQVGKRDDRSGPDRYAHTREMRPARRPDGGYETR